MQLPRNAAHRYVYAFGYAERHGFRDPYSYADAYCGSDAISIANGIAYPNASLAAVLPVEHQRDDVGASAQLGEHGPR